VTNRGSRPRIVPFGDESLLVVFGERVDPVLNQRVHALAAAVRADAAQAASPDEPAAAAWGIPVPGFASLLVPFDPARVTAGAARRRLGALAADHSRVDVTEEPDSRPPVEIPVRYGADDGPDLAEVAARTGLSAAAVVDLHASLTYRVFILGFAPGFAYLGTLARELALPRRAEPRTRVPAGSVAIAGRQTAVYPSATPGGWHLIGRTDFRPWDPGRNPPALLLPGQRVRFVAVALASGAP
jgi:KipI family sensor histidine kinase inhibitor